MTNEAASRPAAEPDDLQTILAENVRRLRSAHGWDQRSLATRSGISQKHLSEIENGKPNATLRTVVRLGKAFGRNPVSLLRTPRRSAAS